MGDYVGDLKQHAKSVKIGPRRAGPAKG